VGASGWDYREPYVDTVGETLIAVQERVLASGDHIWPWDGADPDDEDDEAPPRPSSLAALNAAKEIEEFWDEGTHTILDVDRIADTDEVGAIRPLSATELTRVFGTEQPSGADFDRVYQPGPAGPLGDLMGTRWSGRSMVIFRDGTPDEVFFWGFSGD
jgi:hypothetical protein